MRDVVRVSRLVGAVWMGDVTRSVTGRRWRTHAVLSGVVVLVLAWLVFAVVTAFSGVGDDRIPSALRTQVLVESALGTGLASACITSVLTVLAPSIRSLDTMLASAPISRGARSFAMAAPTVIVSSTLAPVVLAPLLASGTALIGGADAAFTTAAAIILGVGSSCGASASIHGIRRVASTLGRGDATATSVAAVATICGAVVAYRTLTTSTWVASLSGAGPLRFVTATVAALVVTLVAVGLLLAVVKTTRASGPPETAGFARRLPRFVSSHRGSTAALLALRDPMMTSSLVIVAALLIGTRVGVAIIAEPDIQGLLFQIAVIGTPAALLLPLYSTDRRTLWRRSLVISIRSDPWNTTSVVAMVAAGVVVAIAAASVFIGTPIFDSPTWLLILPAVWLCLCSAVLAGVAFPSDLDLPGAGVLAAILTAALTAFPSVLVDDSAPPPLGAAVSVLLGLLLMTVSPFAVRHRRMTSVLS
ncbi:hypothetical protein [Curtobacterium sp. MCBA15_001]|uniref:hypothetical protein n=1 Tax=Curtobacterium sp. MCBA15_001 TaxID=1898731 RepID=UPI001113719A|nr:hypothetical protein [Curtobacterium sp. MCBA15_001]